MLMFIRIDIQQEIIQQQVNQIHITMNFVHSVQT